MLEDWKPLDPQPQIVSIAVVAIILVILSVVYFVKSRRIKSNEAPHGYVLLVEIAVGFVRNLVVDTLGPKMEKITPYVLYLFAYIGLSNIIGIFGLDNPTSSLTVTLSLAIVTWVIMWAVGLKYQKLSYLKGFCLCVKTKKGKKIPVMINPLEVISNIAPLISLSFRLWGNILAGSIIATLWFFFTGYIWRKVPVIGTINILGGLTIAPIRAYFDLLSGCVQALVFATLSMMYWKGAGGDLLEQDVNSLKEKANLNTIKY